MPITADRPLAVYYEHPDWFRPLFRELDRRGLPYTRLLAGTHRYDPAERDRSYALVLNRMSPSAHLRGGGRAVFFTLDYLEHLEKAGMRVVNGSRAYRTEISKAAQLGLLERLGLRYPRARVINSPAAAPEAAAGLRFPIVLKPNVGGSGAGIRRFDSPAALRAAVAEDALDLGPDGTALVQEYIRPADGHIVRVEVLDGRVLYAIRVFAGEGDFNLCPADVCRTTDGTALERTACPADLPDSGIRVEPYDPPAAVVEAVQAIAAAAAIDVGGIEYLEDARDGRRYFYDINALSNFVADGPRVVGFDPFALLVDYLEREAV